MPIQIIRSDFSVNTTTTGQQRNQSAAALANGYIVTWQSQEGATLDHDIFGQRYDADGNAADGEFPINTMTAGDQRSPVVATRSDGSFVVTWDSVLENQGVDVYARVFSANGSPVEVNGSSIEFRVNTTGTDQVAFSDQVGPVATGLTNGGFAVAFGSRDGGSPSHTIRARSYDANGLPTANDFVVNTTPGTTIAPSIAPVFSPVITALSGGRFVVAWVSGETGFDIRARIFNADGTAGANDFLVNEATPGNQFVTGVTQLSDDRFVVTWTDLTSTDIEARIFDSNGTPVTGDFTVNTTTTTASAQQAPSVAALPDGRFAIAWMSDEGGTASHDIRGRIYNADGTASGHDFVINTGTANLQSSPRLAAQPDGNLLVTWFDEDLVTGEQNVEGALVTVQPALETGAAGENETKAFDVLANDAGNPLSLVTLDSFAVSSTNPLVDGVDPQSAFSIVPLQPGYAGVQFTPGTLFDALNAGETASITVNYTSNTGSSSFIVTVNGADDAISNGNAGGTVTGTAGNDLIDAQGGNDFIDSGAGNDTVLAGSGNDIVSAGDGNDAITGGSGLDFLSGGNGDDTFFAVVGDGSDGYAGGAGTDTLDMSAITVASTINLGGLATSSQTGVDALLSIENAIGGSLSDTMTGTGSANRLDGRGGDDTIDAGGGADVVIGGSGNDTMNGGAASDTYLFAAGFGNDVIRAFGDAPGNQDVLDLTALGISSSNFSTRVAITDVGADTLVTVDGAASIRLAGVRNAATVGIDDFAVLA